MGVEKVLAFEPLDSAFGELLHKYGEDDRVTLMQCALGDTPSESWLNVTQGDGMGSSFLREYSGPYTFIGKQSCPIVRFDSLGIDLSGYDTLVVDTQGMEMQVIRGFGHKLKAFDFLNIECSRVSLYEGGFSAQEVIDYLASQGFQQETPIQDHNDIMFRRRA
jgi:FkbM family methyltransferase